ncbi:MAG TPA: hypothetical protein DD381_08565 [Lentisphaeria bacterium]|nr:MAG: hypothetical protein A2X47_11120 [Lentisphaerae bacterium GWF2_38_69]HBM16375.1 hypothetical protein [Lentisphaeria bacterium]
MSNIQSDSKVEILIKKATDAAAVFSQLTQEHTDRIVKAVYQAGLKNRVKLAKMAVEETKIGVWQDKVIKNVVGSLLVYEDIKDMKTAGIISDDRELGIMEIAQPIGPILAIIPVTNPTSTVIFKILIALKTRNPVIISPHSKAIKSSVETARICYEAALSEDAPENCIQWARDGSESAEEAANHRAHSKALMSHPKLALILATGGSGIVKAAYASGTPAYGVGAGNVPVFIDKSAKIPFAVENILISKTFDNGTICASEQAVVVEKSIAKEVIEEFKKQKGYFLTEDEVVKVEKFAYDKERDSMSEFVVGQSVKRIAELAGINIPEGTRLLIAHQKKVGKDAPLSSEILCPIIAFYTADNFDTALSICIDLNFHGGMGHSASLYANDKQVIERFAMEMNAGRIVLNSPSSQGGVGGIYNKLHTSLTLGCGTTGKNITTDNVTALHLMNIQRVASRRENIRLFKLEKDLFFNEAISVSEFENKYNENYL